jgi:hypothetical protein
VLFERRRSRRKEKRKKKERKKDKIMKQMAFGDK